MHTGRNLSIVIVTWNGLHLLKESLDSVVAACKTFVGESEIIIVDNGSQDRTVDVLLDFYPQIRILALGQNFGFSVGNNKGVALSRFEHVLFLNNDVKVPENFLNELFDEWTNCDENRFSLSPQSNFWEGRELTEKVFCTAIGIDLSGGDFVQNWAVSQYQSLLEPGVHKTIYNTGAALLVNKQKYLELGGFNPLFSPAYWEDVDLCYHAWKRGWGSYVTTRTKIWHKISASSGQLKADFKQRLMTRNFFLFYLLNVLDEDFFSAFQANMKKFFVLEREDGMNSEVEAFIQDNHDEINKIRGERQLKAAHSDRDVIAMVKAPSNGCLSRPHF
jgi:GT2 family glycosyltransferase